MKLKHGLITFVGYGLGDDARAVVRRSDKTGYTHQPGGASHVAAGRILTTSNFKLGSRTSLWGCALCAAFFNVVLLFGCAVVGDVVGHQVSTPRAAPSITSQAAVAPAVDNMVVDTSCRTTPLRIITSTVTVNQKGVWMSK